MKVLEIVITALVAKRTQEVESLNARSYILQHWVSTLGANPVRLESCVQRATVHNFFLQNPHSTTSMFLLNVKSTSKASSYSVLGSWKKQCSSKTVHHEVGQNQKIPCKIQIKCSKFLRYADFQQKSGQIGKKLQTSSIFGTNS